MKQFDANLTHLGVFFVKNALNVRVFAAYQGSSTIFSYLLCSLLLLLLLYKGLSVI